MKIYKVMNSSWMRRPTWLPFPALSIHNYSNRAVVPPTTNKKADWIWDFLFSIARGHSCLLNIIHYNIQPSFSLCLTTYFLRAKYNKVYLLSRMKPFLMTWLCLCSSVFMTFLHYQLSSTHNFLYKCDSVPSTFGKTLLFLLFTIVRFIFAHSLRTTLVRS